MTEKQAQKIFEKYNPSDAAARCPNGRAPVRALLDKYTAAAMNLYGVISTAELVEIFNRQNTEQTSEGEIFTLLLPLVLKKKWYCFYKGTIVHYWALDDFDFAEFWLREQGDKPRFIPEKEEFLKFENQYYEDKTQTLYWDKLFAFAQKEWTDNRRKYQFIHNVKEISEFSTGLQEVSELLKHHGLIFSGKKQAQVFFDLLMEARNNTRRWSNKGYSPSEMRQKLDIRRPKNEPTEIALQKRITVGPNDPCPCGSGRKYKKCCRQTEEAKTAQLSRSECLLFYETWYGLMGFVNVQKNVINAVIKPVYPNPVSDEQVYKVREVLWKNPELIDAYLAAEKLSEEKQELLTSWRDYHKKGMFFIVNYTPEYAVLLGSNEQKEDRLYGIKGISRSLADAIQRELPAQIETVLLPFNGKIIYDGFISSMPIGFAQGAKAAFKEMHKSALVHGIITHLE